MLATGQRARFLEITFMLSKCVCVCPPLRPYITSGVILALNDWLNNRSCYCFMALCVDVIDRHGPSNEMRRQLQPKNTKVRLY